MLVRVRTSQQSAPELNSDTMPVEGLCHLIFVDGLSTAASVNEISGRGVGMSAINLYIEEAGARLDLKIQEGKLKGVHAPFEIVITLPEIHFVR